MPPLALPAQLLERVAESTSRAVQTSPGGHCATAQDCGDLRGRQVFPLRKEQDLPIFRPEAAERLVDKVSSRPDEADSWPADAASDSRRSCSAMRRRVERRWFAIILRAVA
jgi:hypothetical protein